MAKLLKSQKHKVAPEKGVEEDKKIVLVGTYKSGQLEKWPGYYNYPICDGDKIELEFAKKVSEIWLFNAKKEPVCLKAEFVGFKTRDELKAEYGYPATGKPHGTGRYILYSTSATQIYNPASGLAEKVIVRLKDFATSKSVQKKLRDYLASPDRKDPILANCLPPLLTKIPTEVLRVCEAAVQMDYSNPATPDSFVWSVFPRERDVVDQLEYSVVCINEFARQNGVPRDRACDFLCRYKGLEHLVRFYDVESTMPLGLIVEDLGKVCRMNGGRL